MQRQSPSILLECLIPVGCCVNLLICVEILLGFGLVLGPNKDIELKWLITSKTCESIGGDKANE